MAGDQHSCRPSLSSRRLTTLIRTARLSRSTPPQIAVALALAASGGLALAQATPEAIDRARRQAAAAEQRSTQLEAAAAQAAENAARARAAEAAVARRVLAAEAEIDTAEQRARRIAKLQAEQQERLAAQQAPVTRLLAALQMMARRPATLALVQPGSLTDMVHVRALLDAQLPVIGERTSDLRMEMAQGAALQRQADRTASRLRDSRHRLENERLALARLETRQRVNAQILTNNALRQSDRAMALAEKARNLGDLMDRLDSQAAIGERLAALPGPVLRPLMPGAAPAPAGEATAPAVTLLTYRLPVNGRLVRGMGEISEAGVRSRGISIRARSGALVVAPSRGRIVYAGPFRGYGNVVIVEHGGGWTSLLTGLATLRVDVNDAVDQGSPIGRAKGEGQDVTVELRHGGEPVDIVALLGGKHG